VSGISNIFAKILRLADFGNAFGRGECVGRGEQHNGLAAGIGNPQCLLPALACANAVNVEKNVLIRPARRAEPLLEGNGRNVVRARMADKQAQQGACS
jgi:hypothetical protein